jgi:hypothetical protein
MSAVMVSGPPSPTESDAHLSPRHDSHEQREEEMPPAAADDEFSGDLGESGDPQPDQDAAVVDDFRARMEQALGVVQDNLHQAASEKLGHAVQNIFQYYHDIVHAKRIELARLTELADQRELELDEWRRVSMNFAKAVNHEQPDLASATEAGA